MTLMVRGAANFWEIRYIADEIRELLHAIRTVPELSAQRRELVEALLERELYDFRDYLPT